METQEKATEEKTPAGMAWIGGQQKPFYNPRVIKKGKQKGKIEVTYLRSYNFYKTTVIHRKEITKLLPPFDSCLYEQTEILQ